MDNKKCVATKYEESFLKFLKQKKEEQTFLIKNTDDIVFVKNDVQLKTETIVIDDEAEEPLIKPLPNVDESEKDPKSHLKINIIQQDADVEPTIWEPTIRDPLGEVDEVLEIGEEPEVISIDPHAKLVTKEIQKTITQIEENIFEQRHKCPMCPRTCSTIDNLEEHVRTHKLYKCSFCSKWSDDLKSHMLKHHGKKMCPFCKVLTGDLKKHLDEKHLNKRQKMDSLLNVHLQKYCKNKCSDCPHTFSHLTFVKDQEVQEEEKNKKQKLLSTDPSEETDR